MPGNEPTNGPVVELTPPANRTSRSWSPFGVVLALLVAAALLLLTPTAHQHPTRPLPGTSDSPVAVVAAFFDEWNERNVEEALAYLHPKVRAAREPGIGSVAWWENYIRFSVTAYGGEWEWILRDCHAPTARIAQCRVTVAGEPLLDARAQPSVLRQFEIQDGLITRAFIPIELVMADIVADRYAKEQDPARHAAACGIEGRDLFGQFVAYDARCGEFIRPFRIALAEELMASVD